MTAGVDEVGRGPLAGPVVAAAVVLGAAVPSGLRDSKQLSARQRDRLAAQIRATAIGVAVSVVNHDEIDRVNILQASLLAMTRALAQLGVRPGEVLVDGNRACALPAGWDCPVHAIVRGDASVASISAASIVAKTYRDALMVDLDRQYPGYGFSQHFGYPTPAHRAALSRLGPSPIHRRTFAPVRAALASLEGRCA